MQIQPERIHAMVHHQGGDGLCSTEMVKAWWLVNGWRVGNNFRVPRHCDTGGEGTNTAARRRRGRRPCLLASTSGKSSDNKQNKPDPCVLA